MKPVADESWTLVKVNVVRLRLPCLSLAKGSESGKTNVSDSSETRKLNGRGAVERGRPVRRKEWK